MNAVAELEWSDDGYASLCGSLLEKSLELDNVFRDWAFQLGSTEYRFPSMISAKSLAPIAYLKSFPHLATFVTSGIRREESLKSLADECGVAEQIPLSDKTMEPVTQLLTPAACYHFYPRLADLMLAAEVPHNYFRLLFALDHLTNSGMLVFNDDDLHTIYGAYYFPGRTLTKQAQLNASLEVLKTCHGLDVFGSPFFEKKDNTDMTSRLR